MRALKEGEKKGKKEGRKRGQRPLTKTIELFIESSLSLSLLKAPCVLTAWYSVTLSFFLSFFFLPSLPDGAMEHTPSALIASPNGVSCQAPLLEFCHSPSKAASANLSDHGSVRLSWRGAQGQHSTAVLNQWHRTVAVHTGLLRTLTNRLNSICSGQ